MYVYVQSLYIVIDLRCETYVVAQRCKLLCQMLLILIFFFLAAPPTFIERLPLYHGALVNASNINISCRVECSPLCSMQWLKDGKLLNLNSSSSLYSVSNTVIPPDTRTSDFESIRSMLMWNMSAWPGGQLDRIHDSANYTCQSTHNEVGPGVRSSTAFRVECKCHIVPFVFLFICFFIYLPPFINMTL